MYRDKSPKRIIDSFLFVSHLYKITPLKLSTLKCNAKIMNFKDMSSSYLFKALLLVEYLKGSENELRQFIDVSIVFIDNFVYSVPYKTFERQKQIL